MEIRYSHPDEGLLKALNLIKEVGYSEESRNGPVIRFPEPVMLINENPVNRVSVSPVRDANPFFHFMESLWMIAGMNTVAPMAFYNGGIGQYSDDGRTLRGTAYGHKWRKHFGYDQLDLAIKRLRNDPTDRRIVMTMWDPNGEWKDPISKDLSCNLQVIFGTREEGGERVLDMEVTNRSNDIVYGCLGSNVFHFSFLLEYVAFHAGLKVGRYYQVAFNLHGYTQNPAFARCYESANKPRLNTEDWIHSSTSDSLIKHFGFQSSASQLENFVITGDPGDDAYLQKVGVPLVEAYRVFKLKSKGVVVDRQKRINFAQEIASQCADPQLGSAAVSWLGRRGSNDGSL